MSYAPNSEAVFKLDDSQTPGFARVRIMGQASVMLKGAQHALWRVEVVEIIRPSTIRRVRPGQKLNVSEKHLSAM